MWAHGLNLYQLPPNHRALESVADQDNPGLTDRSAVWEDIRDNVNHPWLPTVYPPLMQLVFRFSHWLAPGSVLVLKALLAGFDLLAGVVFFVFVPPLATTPGGGLVSVPETPRIQTISLGARA